MLDAHNCKGGRKNRFKKLTNDNLALANKSIKNIAIITFHYMF